MLLVVDMPNNRKVSITENCIYLDTPSKKNIQLSPGHIKDSLSEDECKRVLMAMGILAEQMAGA